MGLSGLGLVVVVVGGVCGGWLKAICSCWRALVTRGEGGWNGDGRLWLWGMNGVGCGVLCGDGVGGVSSWRAAIVILLVGDVGGCGVVG